MEDREIIALYFARDETAIRETGVKYGNYCSRIARNILSRREDAEECVSDFEHRSRLSDGEVRTVFSVLPEEVFYGMLAKTLSGYGEDGSRPPLRYQTDGLESIISEVCHDLRIFYSAFEITIPIGGSTELTIVQKKEASFSSAHMEAGAQAPNSYELALTLGSNLTFTEQRLSVRGTEYAELLHVDGVPDPGADCTEIVLDPSMEHCGLTVKKRGQQ